MSLRQGENSDETHIVSGCRVFLSVAFFVM